MARSNENSTSIRYRVCGPLHQLLNINTCHSLSI